MTTIQEGWAACSPVLKTGMPARYDTMAGLVPCKVLSIVGTSGAAGSMQAVSIMITRTQRGYRSGEIIPGVWGLHVVPVRSVRKQKYGTRIRYYTVECDEPAS